MNPMLVIFSAVGVLMLMFMGVGLESPVLIMLPAPLWLLGLWVLRQRAG